MAFSHMKVGSYDRQIYGVVGGINLFLYALFIAIVVSFHFVEEQQEVTNCGRLQNIEPDEE